MQRIIYGNFYDKTLSKNLNYIRSVFKYFSAEKKDCILNTARSLIEIQNNVDSSVNNSAVLHYENK